MSKKLAENIGLILIWIASMGVTFLVLTFIDWLSRNMYPYKPEFYHVTQYIFISIMSYGLVTVYFISKWRN